MAKSIESVNTFKIAGEDTPAAVSDAAALTFVALDDDTGATADAEADLIAITFNSTWSSGQADEIDTNIATLALAVNALGTDLAALRTTLNAVLASLRTAGVLPS